jgi:metal-responsive CopG/Arc/MetJ family transcriptional regulator
MRAHVVLPSDVIEEVDILVGRRHRSAFLAEAVREKLASIRLQRAAEAAAGSVSEATVPEWATPDSSDDWVRTMRRADALRLRRATKR